MFEALQTEDLTATQRFVLAEIMGHIEAFEARMSRFETALQNGLAPWQSLLAIQQTLPCIDPLDAAMLMVEIGADRPCSAAPNGSPPGSSISPDHHESAGKRNSGKIRKGNAWVRRLLCEFAQAAARSRCALKDTFTALTIRQGRQKSIVALAHKRLRMIYALLKNP